MKSPINTTERARELRQRKTKSESLLWGLLRSRQLCGLKFRREHPIGPHFADFACVAKKLVVEIDGGYHDHIGDKDIDRERYLKKNGWKVVRFSDKEVEDDNEAIGIAIARLLQLKYEYSKRNRTGSGSKAE